MKPQANPSLPARVFTAGISVNLFSPDTAAGRLRKAVFELYQQHQGEGTLPTSARFLFYELVALKTISKTIAPRTDGKTSRRPDQNLIDALTDLRNARLIPWTNIVDETRELTQWEVYDSIADALRNQWENARLNLWEDLPPPPMVICESRSLKGVLTRLAWQYQCSVASTNGQCVGFLHTVIGPALTPGQQVLYLGDADFSGNHIEMNTRTVLEEIVGDIDVERVAITDKQIDDFDLPVIQKYDKRTKSSHPAVETEALGQSRIVGLLRERLEQLLPKKRRDAVLEREAAERAKLGRKLGYDKRSKRGSR